MINTAHALVMGQLTSSADVNLVLCKTIRWYNLSELACGFPEQCLGASVHAAHLRSHSPVPAERGVAAEPL